MNSTANRWWIYQKERFPVFAHGLLIFAFSFSAVCYSAQLRSAHWPELKTALVAFISCFIFFFQLRIADEFKDFAEDSLYRPYRPIPRGLIKLWELGALSLFLGFMQLVLAFIYAPILVVWLGVVWIYLAFMSKEFFVRHWLKQRPFTYMWTHMMIIPLIDFYATATEWITHQHAPPSGLIWFLIVSFFNGMVIEIGRKLRAPEGEEHGVETYTRVWGQRPAVLIWLGMMGLTAISALVAAYVIAFFTTMLLVLSLLLSGALFIALRFLAQPKTKRARLFEHYSGIWTLCMYLSLGVLPMILRG